MHTRAALAVAAFLAFTASTANAALVRYNWSIGPSGGLLGASGYWDFNDTDVVAGASLSGLQQAWGATWSTMSGTFALDSTTGHDSIFHDFQLAPGSTQLQLWNFCASLTGICSSTAHPAFQFQGLLFEGGFFSQFAGTTSTTNVVLSEIIRDNVVTGPGPTPVPEPGTLLLLSGGLLAVGLFRRRRSTN